MDCMPGVLCRVASPEEAAGYLVGCWLIERAEALVINRRTKRHGMRWRCYTESAVVALRVQERNTTWDGDDLLHSAAA